MTCTENRVTKIVVYSYYGCAVYGDGRLLFYASDAHPTARQISQALGVEYEERGVRWEDWPGMEKKSDAVYHPPAELALVEDHFRRLEERRRVERIAYLKAELARLERATAGAPA